MGYRTDSSAEKRFQQAAAGWRGWLRPMASDRQRRHDIHYITEWDDCHRSRQPTSLLLSSRRGWSTELHSSGEEFQSVLQVLSRILGQFSHGGKHHRVRWRVDFAYAQTRTAEAVDYDKYSQVPICRAGQVASSTLQRRFASLNPWIPAHVQVSPLSLTVSCEQMDGLAYRREIVRSRAEILVVVPRHD